MTITTCDASIVIDAQNGNHQWCVYEHHVVLEEGAPPTMILVGACKLNEVFNMTDGKTNSEWAKVFANGGKLLLRIVAVADDKPEAVRHAQGIMRDKQPICNLRGFDLKTQRNAIKCLTNGRRYNSQSEAANDLGINQGQLSRHLRGTGKHVNGFVFAYAPPEE